MTRNRESSANAARAEAEHERRRQSGRRTRRRANTSSPRCLLDASARLCAGRSPGAVRRLRPCRTRRRSRRLPIRTRRGGSAARRRAGEAHDVGDHQTGCRQRSRRPADERKKTSGPVGGQNNAEVRRARQLATKTRARPWTMRSPRLAVGEPDRRKSRWQDAQEMAQPAWSHQRAPAGRTHRTRTVSGLVVPYRPGWPAAR